MKKLFTLLIAVIVLSSTMVAQTYVSTTPQKRGVLIEHFGGRNCGYCPDGHRIVNDLMQANPGKVFASSIHAGGYSPTDYPNFNTTDGNNIHSTFPLQGYPSGVVNRSTEECIGRGLWTQYTNEQLQQNAECNIGGKVVIDRATRKANFEVEFYYTSSGNKDTHQFNVIMLQDNIIATQSGSSSNPSQVEGELYRHMHVFRDCITPVHGTDLSPTTAGSYIPLDFTYQIPETIGSPNGSVVELSDVRFLVFVTEDFVEYDRASRTILNVTELPITIEAGTEPNLARIKNIKLSEDVEDIQCDNNRNIIVSIENLGSNAISSMELETSVNNGTIIQHQWTGNIDPAGDKDIELTIELADGENDVMVKIAKLNNVAFDATANKDISHNGVVDFELETEEEEITIVIAQDRYGTEISWKLYDHFVNAVIASGGPYSDLASNGTEVHEHKVSIKGNYCLRFVISDEYGDGFCGGYGDGYYKILDADGVALVQKNGDIGLNEIHMISTSYADSPTEDIEVVICEGEDYTEYGFEFIEPEAGTYNEQSTYNGTVYNLTLIVRESPEVKIDVYLGSNDVTLTASGADTYLWSTGETTASITVAPTVTTTYSVVGTKDGCEGTAEFTVNVIGIEENTNAEATVYPNPTNGNLNVTAKSMTNISIINALGQTVFSQDVDSDNETIDMTQYNAGVYMIRIVTENGISIKRVNVVK